MKGVSQTHLIIGLVLTAFVIYLVLNAQQDYSRPCTLEAKLCPDGSSVGRTGPNCEFAPCPSGEKYCTPESRNADVCVEVYKPVCGWFGPEVQCVRYPCASTFSNSCEACRDASVSYYTEGDCPA